MEVQLRAFLPRNVLDGAPQDHFFLPLSPLDPNAPPHTSLMPIFSAGTEVFFWGELGQLGSVFYKVLVGQGKG